MTRLLRMEVYHGSANIVSVTAAENDARRIALDGIGAYFQRFGPGTGYSEIYLTVRISDVAQ